MVSQRNNTDSNNNNNNINDCKVFDGGYDDISDVSSELMIWATRNPARISAGQPGWHVVFYMQPEIFLQPWRGWILLPHYRSEPQSLKSFILKSINF